MTKTATGLDYPATWQDLSAAIDRVATKRLLFVCGSIKSGTTWTQLWLDRHPEIACRGEGCFFSAYAGALQSLCRNASTTVALQNAHKPALYPEFPAITLPHVQLLLRQTVLGCLAAYGDTPGIAVVAEKTPTTILGLDAVFTVFPEARVLILLRDGRDVALSAWHENMRQDARRFTELFPDFDAFLPEIARIWTDNQQAARTALTAHPDHVRQIRYEDLLSDPGVVLTGVFDWLGVSSSPDIVTDCLTATAFSTLSGGRRQGEEDPANFFRNGTAGQWRMAMTATQQARFLDIAGDMLSELGYL